MTKLETMPIAVPAVALGAEVRRDFDQG